MKKIISIELILLLTIILSFNCFATEQTEEKEDLYSQLCKAVIRLEYCEETEKEKSDQVVNTNKSIGTAFFVWDGYELFVVTARHVVENNSNLQARVKCKNRITGSEEIILLKLKKEKWIFHPQDKSEDTHYVDVAVMKIGWIVDRDIKAFRYEPKNIEEFLENQLPLENPLPPRSILLFGFPLDIGLMLKEQRPMCRLGVISMATGKKFLKVTNDKFAEEKTILIDAKVFPGNSGSPVINQPLTQNYEIQLLGLVFAANERLNYAFIEPVSRIRETIEIAKESPMAIDCWYPLN